MNGPSWNNASMPIRTLTQGRHPGRPAALVLALMLTLLLPAGRAIAVVDTVPQTCGDNVCLWDKPRIDAPEGWSLDEATSKTTRVSVFVPQDRGFSGAPVVFYARASKRQSGDLQAFIASDLDRMLSQQLTLSSKPLPDLRVANRAVWRLREVSSSAADGTHETMAYVQDGDYFVTLVLSAKTAADHDRQKARFQKWLRSYAPAAPL
jgi:hypothetical protein